MKLLKGNNLDILKTIPDKSVDLIVTDPPYEHVTGGMSSKTLNKGTYNKDSYMVAKMSQFKHDDVITFLDAVMPKMKKVNMFVFCSKLQLAHYFDYLNNHKKLKYDLLIWDKSSEQGKYGMKSSKFFAQDIEYVVRIYEGGVSLRKLYDDTGAKLLSQAYMKRQRFEKPAGGHETMKPVELIAQYIQLASDEGDLVLDPFMGSGTTGVASVMTSREFIGMEIDETYFDLATERVTKAISDIEKDN